MALLIVLIVAVLVVIGLVAINMRAFSPRDRENADDMHSPIKERTEQEPANVVPLPSSEVIAETEQEIIDDNDEFKMKDSDYRLALQKMQGAIKDSSQPKQPIRNDQHVMLDHDYRETLKALSNKKHKENPPIDEP